jgi:hypothetical protein
MGREIRPPRTASSTGPVFHRKDLTMILLIIAALLGLAFIACMGLLRVIRELMDTATSEEGAALPPEIYKPTRHRMRSENGHDL